MTQMSHKALLRVYNKLLGRIPRDRFGADYNTLAATRPGLYRSILTVRREIKRRFDFRDVNGTYRFGPTKDNIR